MDDRPALQVHNQRQVAVARSDADLVDGELPQVLELGPGETTPEIVLDDILDDVPTDAQVAGHILDGHEAGQLQGVAAERLRVAAPGLGEGQRHLADGTARPALDARDRQYHGHRPTADGETTEVPLDLAARRHTRRTTDGATAVREVFRDPEDHAALLEVGGHVPVATNAKRMVQQTGGHAGTLPEEVVTQLPMGPACPPFDKIVYAKTG